MKQTPVPYGVMEQVNHIFRRYTWDHMGTPSIFKGHEHSMTFSGQGYEALLEELLEECEENNRPSPQVIFED